MTGVGPGPGRVGPEKDEDMRYYYHPMSTNCRKTTALLDHLGLEADRRVVDLSVGAHLEPEFLAVNPNGKVPALVDGELRLWESNAIAIHLAEKAGSPMWPADSTARLDVLRWMFWEQGHLMHATGVVFFERLLKPMLGEGQPDEAKIRRALGTFGRLASVLDGHLATRAHLVGDDLTVADWAVAGNMTYADDLGLPIADHPHLARWLARLDDVPAWRAGAARAPGAP